MSTLDPLAVKHRPNLLTARYRAIYATRKQPSNHAISTWTAGIAFARSQPFTIRSWEMNAKQNSYLDVAVFQPKTLNALELMRANKAATQKRRP